jgi:hypothetical protein
VAHKITALSGSQFQASGFAGGNLTFQIDIHPAIYPEQGLPVKKLHAIALNLI